MADKYFRLVCFVVNICPEPLREFFIKLAKDDSSISYTGIGAYLSHRHPDVLKLKRKRKIRDDQYDLLYPVQGTADVNKWDVTLLITLITEMFDASLQPMQTYLMNEIRGIRNQLQHLPNTSSMSDKDFDIYWGRLDTAAMTLAKEMFNATHEAEFRQKICDAKTSHLPDLGDALRIWYEETIRQMADTIQEMKIKLDEVGSNTKETMSILRKVTVEKPGPAGDKNKILKTADSILMSLQASFETTMKELPEGFNAPSEVADIRTKLRDSHHVIVTGSDNSRYFETTLAAIKGMDYNYKRSVEMHESSDWRHIDPKDVDLVLCRNPFGSFSYDGNKAKSMDDIFNRMMHTTKGDGDNSLDIIMITDSKILAECKQFHDHDILEDVVKVFDNTSETHPVDLTHECRNQDVHSTCSAVSNNLKVMTSNLLKQYRISSSQVDEEILRKARLKFKSNKAIVLTGPKKCGKTSVAVALASSYDPSQCILLTESNDFKTIDLKNTCLVIIDEFAGKYCYDEKDVYKWYSMFDHLYNTITAGQMNVIITCEKSKLDKCCDEVSPHPVLEHRVSIPERTIVIKQEILQSTELVTDPLSPIHGHQRVTHNRANIPDAQGLTSSHVWSIKDKHKRKTRVKGDRYVCDIQGCCLLPSGEILLADNTNKRLKKLDSRYKVISVLNMAVPSSDVCYIGDNVAVVAAFYQLKFVDIRGGMTFTRSVDTDDRCYGLAYGNNQLYVIDGKSVYIYSKDGIRQRILYTHQSNLRSNKIALNDDGSLIYISNLNGGLVTIDSSGNHLYTFTDSELGGASGVCVDGEGHVLVPGYSSGKILQLSSDGKKKLGIISQGSDYIYSTKTLCFDKENTVLVVAGNDDNITVLKLQ
ncbi:uncharacterized protein LOC128554936 [Mercenaria mercenaria]|uniref:uncharacterized protein LOC128554936 n=1 Tax=Mercenaria mercenaria TaxID=6596 RepID=UPI00234EFDF2|nr:uncharacterized protein LOC128554936 [Mercenaria mercenaria]